MHGHVMHGHVMHGHVMHGHVMYGHVMQGHVMHDHVMHGVVHGHRVRVISRLGEVFGAHLVRAPHVHAHVRVCAAGPIRYMWEHAARRITAQHSKGTAHH